jgi:hypothetical protein
MWCGRRPSDAQAPAHLVLASEQTLHQLAAETLSLMCQCLRPVCLQPSEQKHVIDYLKLYLLFVRVHPVRARSKHYTRTGLVSGHA